MLTQGEVKFCNDCVHLRVNEELLVPHLCAKRGVHTHPDLSCFVFNEIHESNLPIDDGGTRITYDTGATREPSVGKGRYDLITPHGLDRLAKWYELGAIKYTDRNWEKGIPASRCIDSAFRHMAKWLMGYKDEDHLAAATWNLMAIMHFEILKPELIDIEARGEKNVD